MVMAEIRGALAGGATREQLEAAGYKRSSVYQAQKQLVKPGDGRRRRARVQPVTQVPAVRSATPALLAPSDELIDMRSQVALVKLANELAVAKQQAVRLKPETPEPPNEITNARAMLGFFSDLKTVFPAPEPTVSMPVARGLSPVQQLEIDIKRLEMLERNEERAQVREQQAQERRTEVYQEIGGYLTKGLGTLVSAFQESKAATPARVRAPALNPKAPALEGESTGKFPAMIQSSPGVWTRPIPPNTDVVPSEEIMLKPEDRPGGTWIASADAETGEVISWAWAADPPPETVRQRLQRIGIKAAGQNSPHRQS